MTTEDRKKLLIAACAFDRLELQMVLRQRRESIQMSRIAGRWLIPAVTFLLPRKFRILGVALRAWSARLR